MIGPLLLAAMLSGELADGRDFYPAPSSGSAVLRRHQLHAGRHHHRLRVESLAAVHPQVAVRHVQLASCSPRRFSISAASATDQSTTPDSVVSHVLIGSYIAASFMDAMTTAHCLGAKRCNEANPILAAFQDSPLAFGLVKGIATAGVSYLLLRLHRGHPRLTQIVAAILAAGSTYIAVRNVKTAAR